MLLQGLFRGVYEGSKEFSGLGFSEVVYRGSSTMIVEVPCASTFPSGPVTSAWAEIIRRPFEMTFPSARTRPVSGKIGREKFTFVSTVVYPVPAGSKEWQAHPVALSIKAIAQLPCTVPKGLSNSGFASPSNAANPSPTSTSSKDNTFAIGGGGKWPSIMACSASLPLNPAASGEFATPCCFFAMSFIGSSRPTAGWAIS